MDINGTCSCPDAAILLFEDDAIDDRLADLPDSIKNAVAEAADALLEKSIPLKPDYVAAVVQKMGDAPPEPELLRELLVRYWWIVLNDATDIGDPRALQAHLARAPTAEHPAYHYVLGIYTGLWIGHHLRGGA